MRKNQLDRDIVVVLIATLVTVVVWVASDIYQSFHKNEAPIVEAKYLEEFDPTLDIVVLDELEKKLP